MLECGQGGVILFSLAGEVTVVILYEHYFRVIRFSLPRPERITRLALVHKLGVGRKGLDRLTTLEDAASKSISQLTHHQNL